MIQLEHNSSEPNPVEVAPNSYNALTTTDDPFTPITFRALLFSKLTEGRSEDELASEKCTGTCGETRILQLEHGRDRGAGAETNECVHGFLSDEGTMTDEREDLSRWRKVSYTKSPSIHSQEGVVVASS